MALPTKSLDLSTLGPISLRTGDNDAQRKWGGQVQQALTGTPVKQLQTALIALGLLEKADGSFGPGTQKALKHFQWYGRNIFYRLKVPDGSGAASGTICTYPAFTSVVPGVCDTALAREILAWRAGTFITTTPLVRLSLANVSNISIGLGFKPLTYPDAQADELLFHPDFAEAVTSIINTEAVKAKVQLSVNQAFRRADVPPSGAIVPPAKKSQHLVGHAIDLNIVDGKTVNTADMFKSGKETDAADTFIQAVKDKSLRWGGDFSPTDPVHFDNFLSPNGEDFEAQHFFVQRCFHLGHPMRVIG